MSNLSKTAEYLKQTKFVVLATLRTDGAPSLRTLASFANDELKVYFSTGINTSKVSEIESNPNVTLLFQHEGQQLSTFKNVTLTGRAKQICCDNERTKAIQLLSEKSPRFKERAEKGELSETAIFKVEPKSLKYLDFSNGISPGAVEEFKF